MNILDILKEAIVFKSNEINGISNTKVEAANTNVQTAVKTEAKANVAKPETNTKIYTALNSRLHFLPLDEQEMCVNVQSLIGYKGSLQQKIVETLANKLTKQSKMSNKQRYYIEWGLNNFKRPENVNSDAATKLANENVTVNKPVESNAAKENITVTKESENVASKQETANKEVEVPKATGVIETPEMAELIKPYEIVYVSDTNIFRYKLMNDKAYITGLNYKAVVDELDISIPDTVKSQDGNEYVVVGIAEEAFRGCNITSVKIGRNIVDIGKGAFKGCQRLRYADLSASSIQHISAYCFYNDIRLQGVAFNNSIKRIHEAAFFECRSLKSLNLPESLDTVANKAFYGCIQLKSVLGSVVITGNDSFKSCINLKKFDFSKLRNVGPSTFALCGFEEITIPGNVTTIGNRAFRNCPYLSKVVIEEGVDEIGEMAFSKDTKAIKKLLNKSIAVNELDIYLPKSLKNIESGALSGVKMAYVYMGSRGESFCIRWNIKHTCVDADESVYREKRDMGMLLGDPMRDLWRKIKPCYTTKDADINGPSSSDPESYTLDFSKYTKYKMDKEMLDYLGIADYSNVAVKEPHVKFKGYLNLISSVYDETYLVPLTNNVTRLKDTFTTDTTIIYDDGFNRIVKVINTEKDTLDFGGFVAVLQGNVLVYIAPLSQLTDAIISPEDNKHDRLIVDGVLNNGSNIGKVSAILGTNGKITDEATKTEINVGLALTEILHRNAIEFNLTEKDSVWYLPAIDRVLQLHDAREWEGSGADKKLIGKTNYSNLGEILNFKQLVDVATKNNKYTKWYTDSYQFYDRISSMKDEYVAKRLAEMKNVRDAKISFMWRVSKSIVAKLGAGRKAETVYPDDISKNTLKAVTHTHLMVRKELDWVKKIGARSLNKTNQYTVENLTVDEYVSNQVVKFSNSYMSGRKGAYVFIIREGNKVHGVFSSTISMKQIIEMLYEMNNYDVTLTRTNLISKADEFDLVPASLFYHITSVSKIDNLKTWNLGCLNNFSTNFNISIYKPTGLLYLTTTLASVNAFDDNGNRVKEPACIPLVPIGYINRALVVAATTNKNVRTSKLLLELTRATDAIFTLLRGRSIYRDNIEEAYNNLVSTRKLLIAGEHNIDKYSGITNDRIRYMMGTVPKTLENDDDGTIYMEIPDDAPKRRRNSKAKAEEKVEVAFVDDDEVIDIDTDSEEGAFVDDDEDEDEIVGIEDNSEEEAEFDLAKFEMFKKIAMEHGITNEDDILAAFKEIEAKRQNN